MIKWRTYVLALFMLLGSMLFAEPTRAQLRFEDASRDSGIWIARAATGVSFEDANGDGWEDLTFAYLDGFTWLFLNNADGTFSPEAVMAGGGVQGTPLWIDLDNDETLELVVTGKISGSDRVWAWNGDRLEDHTVQWAFPQGLEVATMAAADYDGDGFVDLFLSIHHDADVLLRNVGGQYFEDATLAAGISDNPGSTAMQSSWIDFDLDGDQDLFSVYDGFDTNRLFVNLGDGTFEERAAVHGMDGIRSGNAMGIAWGDISGDGRPDAYVSRMFEASLFVSDAGSGGFADEADARGATLNGMAWGTLLGDFDNDTDLDIAVANTYGFSQTPNHLYEQQSGLFTDVAADAAFDTRTESVGMAMADFDHDGRLDVVIPGQTGAPLLLRNTSPDSVHWIRVRLMDGMKAGARVSVFSGDAAQHRWIVAGDSFASQSSSVAHFGLGDSSGVDSVRVRWPDGHSVTTGPETGQKTLEVFRDGAVFVHAESWPEIPREVLPAWPNPASHTVHLPFSTTRDNAETEPTHVLATNMLGQNVLVPSERERRWARVDVSGLPQGIYFFQIEGETGNNGHLVAVIH